MSWGMSTTKLNPMRDSLLRNHHPVSEQQDPQLACKIDFKTKKYRKERGTKKILAKRIINFQASSIICNTKINGSSYFIDFKLHKDRFDHVHRCEWLVLLYLLRCFLVVQFLSCHLSLAWIRNDLFKATN